MPPQIDAKKNFLVCNFIVAAMFMLGNLTLPSIFWVYHRIPPTQLCLELFLAGVLASEVVIVGVYASFSPAFNFVRWSCSILSSIVFSLMLYIGICISQSGTYEAGYFMTFYFLPILAYALVGNLVTTSVGSCVRWFSGLNLTLDLNSDDKSATKRFGLMFLFKLTFASAVLLLAFKSFNLPIPQHWYLRTYVVLVSHTAIHLLFCVGLVLSSLLIAMTSRNGRKLFAITGVLIVLGTLPLVLACQMLFFARPYGFVRLWLETQAFFLGFTCSLLVVFSLWQWAGLRFVGPNDGSSLVPLGEQGS